MDSQTLPKLPVIDLSYENLKPGSSSWLSVREDVRSAMEEFGCFVAVYDKVPSQLCNTTFAASQELFNLPIKLKIQLTNTKPFPGYIGQNSSVPLFESLGINEATNLENTQSFANIMWPAGNDRFCESANLYVKHVAELDKMVTRMVFESYGIEKYYDSHAASTTYFLVLIKYRVPQMNESNLGVHSHTDRTFTSIIHQNQVNGLEIKTKDGKWIAYEPSLPSSFLVRAGDVFRAWSNGRIHSPLHRVNIMHGIEEARYTIGLTTFRNGMIQTPEELVDEQHPLRFKPFEHTGLLDFLESDEVMEAYCGF